MKSFNNFTEEKNEGSHEKAAKERIKRERRSDANKFDRIMDRAKVADAKEKAMSTKPKAVAEEVREITMQPDLDRLINRVANKNAYKKAIRYYLDYRKANPGKAKQNAVRVAQMTGADYRNLELIFHQMIRDGKLPKHLAWRQDLIQQKPSLMQKIKKMMTK